MNLLPFPSIATTGPEFLSNLLRDEGSEITDLVIIYRGKGHKTTLATNSPDPGFLSMAAHILSDLATETIFETTT